MSVDIRINELVKVHDKNRYFEEAKKAAENGDKYAMSNLAGCYLNAEGTEENVEKALYWFQKAVENGDENAMCSLFTIYRYYNGTTEKNLEKAFYWCQKAAESG